MGVPSNFESSILRDSIASKEFEYSSLVLLSLALPLAIEITIEMVSTSVPHDQPVVPGTGAGTRSWGSDREFVVCGDESTRIGVVSGGYLHRPRAGVLPRRHAGFGPLVLVFQQVPADLRHGGEYDLAVSIQQSLLDAPLDHRRFGVYHDPHVAVGVGRQRRGDQPQRDASAHVRF